MSLFQILVNIATYAMFSFGTLLIWPSRRNVIAWLAFPFFVVGYLIPLLSFNYDDVATGNVIETLTSVNGLGMVGMLIGLALGNALAIPRPRLKPMLDPGVALGAKRRGAIHTISQTKLVNVMLVGCALMTFCYLWMGVVPMFAEDPFLAKFFRGQYKERYDQISIVYRLAQVLIVTALPLAVALVVERRHKTLMFTVAWAVGLIAVSLVRGSVLAGTLILIAAWCSNSTRRMFWFLLVTTTLYCLGSTAFVLLGLITVEDFNPWAEIARGAPDIQDHLQFLGAFRPSEQLTYGLTFFGGLVPGNFYFNPAVFSLAIANDTTDISSLASGGFRLPPSIAGYMAFSWPGAFAVPMLSGVLAGYFTKILRKLEITSLSDHVAFLLWFNVYAGFLISFYSLTYAGALAIGVMAYISFNPLKMAPFLHRRKRKTTVVYEAVG